MAAPLLATVAFMPLLDPVKVFLFRRFGIQQVNQSGLPVVEGQALTGAGI